MANQGRLLYLISQRRIVCLPCAPCCLCLSICFPLPLSLPLLHRPTPSLRQHCGETLLLQIHRNHATDCTRGRAHDRLASLGGRDCFRITGALRYTPNVACLVGPAVAGLTDHVGQTTCENSSAIPGSCEEKHSPANQLLRRVERHHWSTQSELLICATSPQPEIAVCMCAHIRRPEKGGGALQEIKIETHPCLKGVTTVPLSAFPKQLLSNLETHS